MSAPEHDSDRVEVDRLLAAFGNRDLGVVDAAALRERVTRDPEIAVEFAELEGVLGLFDSERELFDEARQPLDSAEAADPELRRLQQTAANSERNIRMERDSQVNADRRLASDRAASQFGHWRWVAAAAVLVVGLSVWFAQTRNHGPALLDTPPGDSVLGSGGVARIQLETTLRSSLPELSWHFVVGTSRYDAVIVNQSGEVLLQRPADWSRSPRWPLTAEQFGLLRAHEGPLMLRILGYDGASILIASSGDLPLRLVD